MGKRRFNLHLLLLSGCYCYAYLFFNRLFFNPADASRFHPVFIQVAIAIVAAVLYFVLRRARSAIDVKPTPKLCGAVIALCIASMAIDFAGVGRPADQVIPFQTIACLLFGAGFVLYALVWTRLYERLSLSDVLVAMAGSLLVSTIVRLLTYTSIYGSIVASCIFCALIGLSLFMANRAMTASSADAPSSSNAIQDADDLRGASVFEFKGIPLSVPMEKTLPFQPLERSFLSRIWTPLLALACIGFGTGLTWGESAATSYDGELSLAAAIAVAALAVFVSFMQKSSAKNYSVFYGVAFPFATLLLLASLLAGDSGIHGAFVWVLGFSYYFALALVELCSITALVSIAQTNGVSSSSAILAKFAVYACGTFVGKLTYFAFGQQSVNTILCIVLMSYIAYNIFVLARNQIEDTKHSAASALESVADAMGERFGLTAREREILVCLLEGRTYEGTGRALFISASTVKTHVKHVYEKMGVKNRDELVEMIFGSTK